LCNEGGVEILLPDSESDGVSMGVVRHKRVMRRGWNFQIDEMRMERVEG
jgi:hypothetical protein